MYFPFRITPHIYKITYIISETWSFLEIFFISFQFLPALPLMIFAWSAFSICLMTHDSSRSIHLFALQICSVSIIDLHFLPQHTWCVTVSPEDNLWNRNRLSEQSFSNLSETIFWELLTQMLGKWLVEMTISTNHMPSIWVSRSVNPSPD